LINGSSDITIGSRRALLTPTANAVASGAPPVASADTRMTCAGAAQTKTVEAMAHHRSKPKSRASAAMPTYVPITT